MRDMGLQATCTARYGRSASKGTLLLETDALVFRGQFRLSVRLSAIRRVSASAGVLTVAFEGGRAAFALGRLAEKWATRIQVPKSRIEKLGLKEGSRVVVIGITDSAFRDELASVTPRVEEGRPRAESDAIFFEATSDKDLEALKSLRSRMKPDGALWVVRPRGRAEITEASVMAAGKAAGLVDVKVVRFSETHTAEKFVIPVKSRPG